MNAKELTGDDMVENEIISIIFPSTLHQGYKNHNRNLRPTTRSTHKLDKRFDAYLTRQ